MEEVLLNKEQKEAAWAPLDKHLLVTAPAGTGKTEVLVSRILYLLNNSVKPEEICAITYTNFAANEMIERIKEKFNDVRKIPTTVGTIHSIFGEMLRYDIESLGIEKLDHKFTIADDYLKLSMLDSYEIRNINATRYKNKENLNKFARKISKHKVSKYLNSEETTDLDKEELVHVYEKYDQMLKEKQMLDFEDLLIYADKLFEKNPEALNYWRNKYRFVLVDECQDLSLLQFKLITKLLGPNSFFFGVGDRHQCIYVFAGADKNIFNKIIDHFKGRNFLQVDLIQNYRSKRAIVNHSNSIKLFPPYASVANNEEGIVQNINLPELIDKLKKEEIFKWVILFRKYSHSNDFLKHSINNKIPFKISRFKLLEKDEVQIIINCLRLVFFENFNSFWQLKNLQYIKFSKKTTFELFRIPFLKEEGYLTLFEKLIDNDKYDWFQSPEDSKTLSIFLGKIKKLRKKRIYDLAKLAENLRDLIFNKEDLEDSKQESISLFIKWLDNIQPEKTIETAISIVLDIENKSKFFKEPEANEDLNYLTLITIHRSKGLGWDSVAVLKYDSLKEAAQKEDDEDEYLEYVSVTRAKSSLYLVEDSKKRKKSKK